MSKLDDDPPTLDNDPIMKNLVINTLLKLKGSGLAESTLEKTSYRLKRLNNISNLLNPEEVKLTISNLTVANSEKQSYVKAYNYFAVINQIEWKRPKYKWERKPPTIPTKENIMKIVSASRKYAVIFKARASYHRAPIALESW